MFQLFNSKQSQLLGIDIGTTSVRLMELSRVGNNYQVDSYGIEYLPEGAIVDADIKNITAVGEAIERLVKRCRPSTNQAAVGIPSSGIIIKVVQFPSSMQEDEIEFQLEVDAERYIPYAIDEVSMDFEIQGPSQTDPQSIDVLLIAARSHFIDARIEVLEMGGLRSKVVDAEVYAIERGYQLAAKNLFADIDDETKEEMVVAIVDIGGTVTTLNVLQDDKIIYNRESNFGCTQLFEEIQSHYDLSEPEAYLAEKENNLPEDYMQEIYLPFRDAIVQQISRSIQMFFSSSGHRLVDQIILAGGGARIDKLCEQIESELSVQCCIADPMQDLAISNKVHRADLLADAPGLLICTGLALRGTQ